MFPGSKIASRLLASHLLTAILASAAAAHPSTTTNHLPTATLRTQPHHQLQLSSLLTSKPTCVLPPTSPFIVLDLQICRPTFNRLLQTPDIDRQRVYHRSNRPIQLTNAPCAISLDRHRSDDSITMSIGEIVGLAYSIVMYCEAAAVGGWTDVDGARDWILTVTAKMQGIGVSGTIAENESLLSDEDE